MQSVGEVLNFAGGLGERIDVSLSLTLSAHINDVLSKHLDVYAILKLSILIVAGIAFLRRYIFMQRGEDLFNEGGNKNASTDSVASIIQRLFMLICVQSVMKTIKVKSFRGINSVAQDAARLPSSAGTVTAYNSFEPVVHSFIANSAVLIVVNLLAQVDSGSTSNTSRIVRSVQYTFAEMVSSITYDSRSVKVLSLIGMVAIPPLMRWCMYHSQQNSMGAKVAVTWLQAVSMTWINLLAAQVCSDEVKLGIFLPAQLLGALTVCLGVQALQNILPELQGLDGYVEWQLCSTIISMGSSMGRRWEFDMLMFFTFLLLMMANLKQPRQKEQGKQTKTPDSSSISAVDAVMSICTIIMANICVSSLVSWLSIHTAIDAVTTMIVSILIVRSIWRLLSPVGAA